MKESGIPTLAHSLECSKCKVFQIIQSQISEGIILKEFLEQHLYPSCQLLWWQGNKCFRIWLKQSKSYEAVLKTVGLSDNSLNSHVCQGKTQQKWGIRAQKATYDIFEVVMVMATPKAMTMSLHLFIIEIRASGIFLSCFRASEWPWSVIMAIFCTLISFFRNELVDISSKIRQCWMGCAVAEFLYFRQGIGAQTKNHKRHPSYLDLVYLIHK